MRIDLRKVPVSWASIEKNTDRHAKMGEMFKHLGIEQTHQINGAMTDPYTIGIADSHILGISGKLPILMMEDDCAVTGNWVPIIEVPDDADAVYLGTSWYGMIRKTSVFQGCVCSDYSKHYVKPYNMLGLHAVLYLTERYRDRVIDLLEEFKENPVGGCDEVIAMEMKKYNIYAERDPFFYQNDGHSEEETLRPISPLF